jgi:hypothetical protein
MKNKLGYVGFLGLLGIVGFFAHNYVYFALFSFLYYLRYFWVIPDELFRENIRRAASPSFFTSMVLYAITVALTAFHVSTLIFVIGLVAGFTVPFVLFTILLTFSR